MLMFCMQPQKLSESSDFQFHELAKSLQGVTRQVCLVIKACKQFHNVAMRSIDILAWAYSLHKVS